MEFLEIPLYDDDMLKLLVRFAINCLMLALIVGVGYYQHQKSRPFVFTFVLMNVMVFFICFTLKKFDDLGLGMALGLFAIFAIIRYRTDSIRVKEMTYLFIVIGIAVINSLSNKKTSYAELAFTNMAILCATLMFERILKTTKLAKQDIVYDNLELLKPEFREQLVRDIEKRTGLVAQRVKLSKIDLEKGTASITVSYENSDSS